MAQVDAFLKLDGIKGESQDEKHKSEIDILSWSWTLNNSGSAHYGAGMGAGKVQVGDIHITKRVDTSSAILLKCCSTGEHIKSGTLVVRKAGGAKALEYFKVDLDRILVSSIRPSSDPSSPDLMEDVALNFGSFKVTYTPQDDKGAGGATVDFAYDITKNKAV